MASSKSWNLFFVTAALALLAGAAHAQVTTATVYGVVQDLSGAIVPAAKVSLTSQDTGAVRAQITDSNGEFGFPFVPVGAYTLRIEALGFQIWESKDIELRATQQSRKAHTLQVGQVSQRMEIAAIAPLINAVVAEEQESMSSNRTTCGARLPALGLGVFSAEYSRALGGNVNVITECGMNNWQGSERPIAVP